MNLPRSFFDLPSLLQESLLWEMELDYDSYESSKEATISQIMNGYIGFTNERIIENSYKNIDPEFVKARGNNLLQHEEMRVRALREFLS